MTFGRIISLGFVIWGVSLMSASLAVADKAPARFVVHATPKTMPAIAFEDADGNKLSLANYKGKLVLLNIWATWCGPCRKEMPTLDRLQEKFGSAKFEVVALSIDRAGAGVVRKFYDEIGIKHLKLVIDPSMRMMRVLRVVGLPMTFLVGPTGNEIGRLIGPAEWDTPEMVAFFKSQIDQTKQ